MKADYIIKHETSLIYGINTYYFHIYFLFVISTKVINIGICWIRLVSYGLRLGQGPCGVGAGSSDVAQSNCRSG